MRVAAESHILVRMTSSPATQALEWDLADRLRKALRVSGVAVAEMADHLDISRTTVSNWLSGRTSPRTAELRVFAIRCGVPFEWLRSGQISAGPDGDGWAPSGSNRRSSDYKSAVSHREAQVLQFRQLSRTTTAQPGERAA